MDPRLRDFLQQAEARAWEWGAWDCCLWLADWGRVLTGIDGGAAWRGRYRTALGCRRLLKREGGVQAVVERGALVAGMKPVAQPYEGCVGVLQVLTPWGLSEVGGLFTGSRWTMLAEGGGVIGVSDTGAVQAWGL